MIVGLEDGVDASEFEGTMQGYPVVFEAYDGSFLVVHAHDTGDAIEELEEHDLAEYAERDPVAEPHLVPDDPKWGWQYGPEHVNAPAAWDAHTGTFEEDPLPAGDEDRGVCVLDTGVAIGHEDLPRDRWRGGYDYVNDDDDPTSDLAGHGTHVTGIAAAGLDNGKGIAGLANVYYYHMKVLDEEEGGHHSWIASGIQQCVDEEDGDVVINMSFGSQDSSQTVEDAIEDAWEAGAVLVSSAGNDGCDCLELYTPAAYEEVIAVTCTDQSKELCGFSNTGSPAELAAPGESIYSTYVPGMYDKYASQSGTSMSAPHVSGAAALLWDRTPNLTNEEVRSLLQTGAEDLGPDGRDHTFGHGIPSIAASFPPTAPENVTLEREALDAVRLSWDPPQDEGAEPVEAYHIYRGHASDPLQRVGTTSADQTTFVDDGPHTVLTAEHRYSVRAASSLGPGGYSSPTCLKASLDADARDACRSGGIVTTPTSTRLFADTSPESSFAASLAGNATCEEPLVDAFGADACLAASGAGDADGRIATSGTGAAEGTYLGASGTGPASAATVAASGTGDAEAFAAVSGTGTAQGNLAVTVTGDTDGGLEVHVCHEAQALVNPVPCQALDDSTPSSEGSAGTMLAAWLPEGG